MNFLKILIHPFFYKFLNKFEVIVRLMHVIETLMGDDLVSLDFMAWKTNQFSAMFLKKIYQHGEASFSQDGRNPPTMVTAICMACDKAWHGLCR